MRSHKNADNLLADAAAGLQKTLDEGNKRASLIIGKKKMHPLNEYVCLFITNFNKIIKQFNLKGSEIKVILKILEYMRFGNLISLSNATIARDLDMDKGNVSRIMKRLKNSELIVDMNGSIFFNPHIACKGAIDEKDPKSEQLLDYAAITLSDYNSEASPSIGTNNIRRKIKEEEKAKVNEIKDRIEEFYG